MNIKFSNYRNAIILFLLVATFLILGMSLPLAGEAHYFNTLPTESGGLQLMMLFSLMILSPIIGLFFGYVFGPFYLFMHKTIIGRQMKYGIQERKEPENFRGTFNALFPALMAVYLALFFAVNPTIIEIIVYERGGAAVPQLMAFVGLIPLMMGVSIALFAPVWFLSDAGIVYTNKRKVKDRREPVEVRSVGGWYLYLLKGYAGVSVILGYFVFTFSVFEIYGDQLHWSTPMALIPFPLLTAILAIPTLIIADLTYDHHKNYIRKFAEKLGISGPLEDPLNIEL